MTRLETERLVSRPWQKADIEPFASLCADPVVMALLGGIQSRETVETVVEKAMEHQSRFGIWIQPILLKQTGEFAGIVGIAEVMFSATFTPAIEIGWRLARAHWGKGYVTEMGREFLRHAFEDRRHQELVSFTVPQNQRSQAVMKRLGFKRDTTGDFIHPKVRDDQPHLKHHVLYRLSESEWRQRGVST